VLGVYDMDGLALLPVTADTPSIPVAFGIQYTDVQ
jgi:hypothetical protein